MDQLTVANEQPIVSDLVNPKTYSENNREDVLKNFTHDLDHELGSLGLSVSTLEDIQVLLAHLVEDMNDAVYKGNQMDYYHDHHRKLRVYWLLLNHTTRELNKEYKKVDEIKDGLFKEVVKKSEKRQ